MVIGFNTLRETDRQAMLQDMGLEKIDDLFSLLPSEIKLKRPLNLPSRISERELRLHMQGLAKQNITSDDFSSFLGGGFYHHHIPAVVDTIAHRGEFLTSYTPYQPGISQGLLQVLFEYQALVSRLTGLPVTNGSCYDGATAIFDAAWVCCQAKQNKRLFVSEAIWSDYFEVLKTLIGGRGVALVRVPVDEKTGQTDPKVLAGMIDESVPSGFVFQSPNAFGVIEDIEKITAVCQKADVLTALSYNPFMSGLMTPPGKLGVNIVSCEGQPLGIPLAAGGPGLGMLATETAFKQFMPGRIVGKVTSPEGIEEYALVYEDREQHVAREKATSNICSNQASNALRASVYLSLLGEEGFRRTAILNTQKAHYLLEKLTQIPGVSLKYSGPILNEFLLILPMKVSDLQRDLYAKKIFPGIDRSTKSENALLVAVTEMKTQQSLDDFAKAMEVAMSGGSA